MYYNKLKRMLKAPIFMLINKASTCALNILIGLFC